MPESEERRGWMLKAVDRAEAFYLKIRSRAHTRLTRIALGLAAIVLTPSIIELVLNIRHQLFDTREVSIPLANPWPGVVIIIIALGFWLVASQQEKSETKPDDGQTKSIVIDAIEHSSVDVWFSPIGPSPI